MALLPRDVMLVQNHAASLIEWLKNPNLNKSREMALKYTMRQLVQMRIDQLQKDIDHFELFTQNSHILEEYYAQRIEWQDYLKSL